MEVVEVVVTVVVDAAAFVVAPVPAPPPTLLGAVGAVGAAVVAEFLVAAEAWFLVVAAAAGSVVVVAGSPSVHGVVGDSCKGVGTLGQELAARAIEQWSQIFSPSSASPAEMCPKREKQGRCGSCTRNTGNTM